VSRPRRIRRSPAVQSTVAASDPFNQQVEDVSFLNQINQKPAFNQVAAANFPFAAQAQIPVMIPGYPAFPTLPPTQRSSGSSAAGGVASTASGRRNRPASLADTRVNDLLLQNARRGGLVRLEPEAEIFDREAVLNTRG